LVQSKIKSKLLQQVIGGAFCSSCYGLFAIMEL
jgi:hypothetical protein